MATNGLKAIKSILKSRRLSNGVYLYVVSIKLNGEEITQLENDNVSNDLNADKANNNLFKHSTGKIVLLR